MAQLNFNANAVPGDVKDFDRLPAGKYQAIIVKTEMCKPNDNGTEQLRIEWEVIEGQFAKRHISTWFSVSCPKSQEAVDIAMRGLKNICESCGMAGFTDTDELCNRPHIISVGDKKKTDGSLDSEVKRCYPSGSAAATPATSQPSAQAATPAHKPPAQPAQQAQPTGGATPTPAAKRPPWMK